MEMESRTFNMRKDIFKKYGIDISLSDFTSHVEELNGNQHYDKVNHPERYWKYYFSNIFPDSLKMFEAIANHQIEIGKTDIEAAIFPKIDTDFMEEKYDTLISLIGFSPEPVMHTICTLKPTAKIYLICSKETERFCNGKFKAFVENFVKNNSLKLNEAEDAVDLNGIGYKNVEVDVKTKTVDSILPNKISNIIENIINENRDKKIAIDITGGKKTMLANAFTITSLYSVPAYYVDFQEYDKDSGKPVYGTEFLNQVTNPISSFIEQLETVFKEIDDDYPLNKKKLGNYNYDELKQKLMKLGWRKPNPDQNTRRKNTPESKKCPEQQLD